MHDLPPKLVALTASMDARMVALLVFLALQVLAVVIGSLWEWHKDHQPAPQNPLTHKPLA